MQTGDTIECPECGAIYGSGATYCPRCGANLARRRRPRIWATVLAIPLVALMVLYPLGRFLPQGQDSPAGPQSSPYTAAISGSLPRHETVGQQVQFSVVVRNTGKGMPHLVLIFDTLRPWTINRVHGCNGNALPLRDVSNYYDFGAVKASSTCRVTLALTARTPGSRTVHVFAAADLRSAGFPDGASLVNRGFMVAQWTATISR
jgi:hypothetical protein